VRSGAVVRTPVPSQEGLPPATFSIRFQVVDQRGQKISVCAPLLEQQEAGDAEELVTLRKAKRMFPVDSSNRIISGVLGAACGRNASSCSCWRRDDAYGCAERLQHTGTQTVGWAASRQRGSLRESCLRPPHQVWFAGSRRCRSLVVWNWLREQSAVSLVH